MNIASLMSGIIQERGRQGKRVNEGRWTGFGGKIVADTKSTEHENNFNSMIHNSNIILKLPRFPSLIMRVRTSFEKVLFLTTVSLLSPRPGGNKIHIYSFYRLESNAGEIRKPKCNNTLDES